MTENPCDHPVVEKALSAIGGWNLYRCAPCGTTLKAKPVKIVKGA